MPGNTEFLTSSLDLPPPGIASTTQAAPGRFQPILARISPEGFLQVRSICLSPGSADSSLAPHCPRDLLRVMLSRLFETVPAKAAVTCARNPPRPGPAVCPRVLSKTGGGFWLLWLVSRSERPGFWGQLGLGACLSDNTGAFKATQRIPGCQFASERIYGVCLICRAIGTWKRDLMSNEP